VPFSGLARGGTRGYTMSKQSRPHHRARVRDLRLGEVAPEVAQRLRVEPVRLVTQVVAALVDFETNF